MQPVLYEGDAAFLSGVWRATAPSRGVF